MVVVITTCIILFCFCVSRVMLDRQIVVNGCSDHKVYNSLLFLCFKSHVRSTDSGQCL